MEQGKTTLVDKLCELNTNWYEVSIWDPMKRGLFQSKKDIDKYLCSLSANARIQFLSHALTEALDMGMKSGKEVLLLNGYYYKYFASELVLGASLELVKGLIASFPKPELVIQLELDEKTAAVRKINYSSYECGLKESSESNFTSFQKEVNKEWSKFDQTNWVKISALNKPEQVVDEVQNEIEKIWG